MWIIDHDGDLIDITGKCVVVDGNKIVTIKPDGNGELYYLMICKTSEEARAEVRRIALAIVYGAEVYEVGKGIVNYTYNNCKSGINMGDYIPVSEKVATDAEEPSDI
jgi:hypothetical protein